MRTIKLTIQYIGTHYCGWQVQPNGLTIQAVLQERLKNILQEEVVVIGAGRTDSGVHALAQVAHFRTQNPMGAPILHRALNGNLPGDISVLGVEEAAKDFHAANLAVAKTYSYLLWNSRQRHPFFSPYVWQVSQLLELDDMHRCLEHLVGRHDFTSFKAADSSAKTSVREILAVALQPISLKDLTHSFLGMFGLTGMVHALGEADSFHPEEGKGKLIAINFKGKGFLKHMIRNIVGTVLEVGKGKMGFKEFKEILEARDRRKAGITAPAKGLFMVKVDY